MHLETAEANPAPAQRACAPSGNRTSYDFTDAADELSVTQAAISHQVRGPSSASGLKLFVRAQSFPAALRSRSNLSAGGTRLQPTQRATEAGCTGIAATTTASFAIKWLVPRLR